MGSRESLMKILDELSFSSAECEAFLKSIQIMKDAQSDEGISTVEKFQELVNGVIDNAI